MKDYWYADNRDLIKWGVLLNLAKRFNAVRILQLAYYRPSSFGQLIIDGEVHDIPEEVISHFRDIRDIFRMGGGIQISVLDALFQNRRDYAKRVLEFIGSYPDERCIVFLDPDTGLEPQKPSLNHVLNGEAQQVWGAIKSGDSLAFYQHQTNRNGQPWIEPKRLQLARALGVREKDLCIGQASGKPKDVVLFFVTKA